MKTDARKLSTEAQQNIRNQAIRMHEKGLSGLKIADLLGVSQGFIAVLPPGKKRAKAH